MRHHLAALVALAMTALAGVVVVRAPAWPNALAALPNAPRCTGHETYQYSIFRDARPGLAHALSAVTLRDGRLRAVWYEGVRELSPDVRIMTATFDGKRWSAARAIVEPDSIGAAVGRYVRKLGNAIVYRDAKGDLVILFVTLSVGGWDGTTLKAIRSRDDGESWSAPESLTTSPLFSFGTNLRGAPLAAAGGFVLLPTSHEFIIRYPGVVLLDADARVVSRRRIGVTPTGIQPFVVPLDDKRVLAFMRVFRGFTLSSRSADAGASWAPPAHSTIHSHDAPVVLARLGRELLMVSSRLAEGPGRLNIWSLVFSVSSDEGASWREIHAEPFGDYPESIPKYPWLMVGPDGLFHMLFTFTHDNRASELLHLRFSRDWIAARKGPPCP